MNCPKCASVKVVPAFVGLFCHDCNELHLDQSMQNNFTESLLERYSDSPPEHNKPGSDGYTDETGKIVK